MNVHDSEKISGIFTESGYNRADEMSCADVVVVNTCSIRHKAEQKVYSDLGRMKKMKIHRPGVKIAVAGCIAQQKGKTLFERFPHVDFVFGPANIESLRKWISNSAGISGSRGHVAALRGRPDFHHAALPVQREGFFRAWVAIMYGCDNFCSYCVVPYTRGRERSRPADDILNEVAGLARTGYREVTLLGQNVNSYGRKNNDRIDFSELLKVLHEVSGIERIRFVTSHPRDFSEKLIETIRDLPKICEHVHLPVQSGSDRVLKEMNRGYTFQDYREKIDMLRGSVPGASVTTDIIVGFPGETDADFERTVAALTETDFDGIFAFKYSPRPDTKAAELPETVDEAGKSVRLDRILKLQEKITYEKNKLLEGLEVEVLVEGPSDTDGSTMTGRTRTNKIVNFQGGEDLAGRIVRVSIHKARLHSLSGEISAP